MQRFVSQCGFFEGGYAFEVRGVEGSEAGVAGGVVAVNFEGRLVEGVLFGVCLEFVEGVEGV